MRMKDSGSSPKRTSTQILLLVTCKSPRNCSIGGDAAALKAYTNRTRATARPFCDESFVFFLNGVIGPDREVYVRKQEWFAVSVGRQISVPSKEFCWTVRGHTTGKEFRKNYGEQTEVVELALLSLKTERESTGHASTYAPFRMPRSTRRQTGLTWPLTV